MASALERFKFVSDTRMTNSDSVLVVEAKQEIHSVPTY